jgi:MFS family permease
MGASAPPDADGIARREIAFINAAHAITHYALLILPTAVLAMARPGGEFGGEYGPIVALATGMFVLYGVGSLPQGWLAARFGRKVLMTAFFLGTGAALAATAFVSSPLGLAVVLAVAGLFAAIYHPIGTAMLVDAAGAKVGRVIGVNGVFGNFGVALAPVVTAFLAQQFGWRAAFLVPGLICVALGFAGMRHPVDGGAHHEAGKTFPIIPAALVRRAVVILLLLSIVSGLVFNAYTLLIPKLMQERLANDPGLLPLVGVLAFFVTLCGAATQFTVGRLIDKTTLKRVFLPMSLVLVPAMTALSMAYGWIALLLAGIVAAVIFGQVTVSETMTARYISPPMRAKMYSVRFFVAFLGSAAAAPLVGFLHERTGNLSASILVLAGVTLISLVCAVLFPDRREELEPELWGKGAPAPAPAE